MLEVQNSIIINASPETIWDWLVNPAKTKMYMFGCEAISSWEPGSQLDWQMMHEGAELIPVTGKVKEYIPTKRLVYTVIDPLASYPNIPENHLNVIYEIERSQQGSILKVIQNGFETAADGVNRYKDVFNGGEGWNPILQQLKLLIEG